MEWMRIDPWVALMVVAVVAVVLIVRSAWLVHRVRGLQEHMESSGNTMHRQLDRYT